MSPAIKIAHELSGELVANRPQGHEQVLRTGVQKTSCFWDPIAMHNFSLVAHPRENLPTIREPRLGDVPARIE